MTNLPVAVDDLGARPAPCTSAPTAAILPSRIRMVPCSIVPWLAVMIVALVIATSVPAAGMGTPNGPLLAGCAGGVGT